ncbi:MAG: hypothetical protein EHM90_06825 [Chloroflexi bacterium]|nr:MAG: hypothetical protein EHM90_06825 [Chloroflexota bacterium]
MTTGKPSRGRTVLVVILGILACIAITLSATTLWVHQIVLNTDRYVSVVSRVAADSEVVEEVSTNLAERVVEKIEIPRLVKPLLQNWLQEQIATFMETDAFADGWAAANRAAHTALVRILRSDSVLPDEPVTISVSQLLVIGIEKLQEVGVVPDDLQLPDPADSGGAERIREILVERLNLDIPSDFGQITIVRPARLEMARQLVRIFDLVTLASVLLAVGLVALTIYLSRNRRRAVLFLGIGVAIAVLAAMASTAAIGSIVGSALAEAGARGTLGAILSALLGTLASALTVLLVFGAVAALGAWVMRRSPTPPQMALAPADTVPIPSAPSAETVPASPSAGARKAAVKPATKPPAKRATKPRAKSPGKPPRTTSS